MSRTIDELVEDYQVLGGEDAKSALLEALLREMEGENSAAPEPSVEQMIEEMHSVEVFRVNEAHDWAAVRTVGERRDRDYKYGATPTAAVAALYRAWRERE